jgi:hypothetical protein
VKGRSNKKEIYRDRPYCPNIPFFESALFISYLSYLPGLGRISNFSNSLTTNSTNPLIT